MKVASYCRVSTDKEDQANSFESQQRYFKDYIARQPDWELYQIYADEGVTGTSTRKRAAFNQMIQDAHMGKFQLILTKEVSRFSRNILDTISYTRELKQLGVSVLFMNDGINTMDPDAELRLSIMGSIAQEESRKTSSRVKWGQTRQMERGVVFGRSLLGYDVKEGCISINPEGASLVRLIFQKYTLEKKGSSAIAKELRDAGYRTQRGSTTWSNSHIMKILKNEKYVGDLVQKKSITPDYLTHDKKPNHGEEALVMIRNHHPPIIDRDLWDLTQAEIKKRNRHRDRDAGCSHRFICSGKIKCGACGASFVARKRRRKDGSSCRYWCCYTTVREGRRRVNSQGHPIGCDIGRSIRDDAAMSILLQAFKSLQLDWTQLLHNVTWAAVNAIQSDTSDSMEKAAQLERKICQIKQKKEAVLDAFFSKLISAEEMKWMNERYDEELARLMERLNTTKGKEISEEGRTLWDIVWLQAEMIVSGKQNSEVFWKSLLERMTVFQDGTVEVSIRLLPQTWHFTLE